MMNILHIYISRVGFPMRLTRDGFFHGFFSDRAVLGLKSVWPRMAWVGLGHPRTCKWFFYHGDRKSPKDRLVPTSGFLGGLTIQ